MATWLVATGVLIQAGALVFATVYARHQLSELRNTHEETTRPFVVIDLETWQTIAMLKVRNIGQRSARNVSFEFSPALESTFDGRMGDGGSYVLAEIEMFAKGIPSLPPGKEHSTLLDQIPKRLEAGLPNSYEVEISYEAANEKMYVDRQTLSLDTLVGLTKVELKGAHEIAKSLEEIKREVKRWSAFGGGSGLRIVTEADMRAQYEGFGESQSSDEPEPEAEADEEQDDTSETAA